MEMKKTIIRDASVKDLKHIAKIHKELFSDHYLGQFSVKIIKNFYSGFINKDVLFLVSETNGVISGFVVGGERKEINLSNSCFIKKNIPLYTFEIVFRPQTWKRSFEKLIKVFSQKSSSNENLGNSKSFTLLSIGVSRLYQGKGVAKLLVAEFDQRIKKHTNQYSLSVKDANLQALRFYEKTGFVLLKVESNESLRLIKEV